jgi:hypothetical protein
MKICLIIENKGNDQLLSVDKTNTILIQNMTKGIESIKEIIDELKNISYK